MGQETLLKERLRSGVFLLPLFLFLAGFVLLPVLGAFWSSLFQDVTFLPRRLVWLENYAHLFHDPHFWRSLRFTVLFVLVSVPLEVLAGLAFALLLNRPSAARGLLRACVLIPWAVPAAVSGRIFELIYNYSFGAANALIDALGTDLGPINWLGTPTGAFFSVVVADAWKTTPFVVIILLAGLAAIPEDLQAQAAVDRAGPVRRLVHVTLPLLRPVMIVAVLFRTIDALRIFDLIFVLTGGGPGGSTASLSLFGYQAFIAGDFGYGAAVSVVLFVMSLSLSLLLVRLGRFNPDIS